jgi:hypothetical protein
MIAVQVGRYEGPATHCHSSDGDSYTMCAEKSVMGEIQSEGKSHVEKTSRVWVDGGYVGYLKELKG